MSPITTVPMATYEGIACAQMPGVFEPFKELLRKHPFDLIVELGTGWGGFTRFLRDAKTASCRLVSVDRADRPVPGVDCRQRYIFSRDCFEEIRALWNASTSSLLLCDNGNKPEEVRRYASLYRASDVIMAHDYCTDRPTFLATMRGKAWDWCEITDADVADCALTPIYQDRFGPFAWGCWKPVPPRLDVVMTTCVQKPERLGYLRQVVESVRTRFRAPDGWRIFVAAQNRDTPPDTLATLESWCKQNGLVYLQGADDASWGENIKLAESRSNADYVLFLEDDWVLTREFDFLPLLEWMDANAAGRYHFLRLYPSGHYKPEMYEPLAPDMDIHRLVLPNNLLYVNQPHIRRRVCPGWDETPKPGNGELTVQAVYRPHIQAGEIEQAIFLPKQWLFQHIGRVSSHLG